MAAMAASSVCKLKLPKYPMKKCFICYKNNSNVFSAVKISHRNSSILMRNSEYTDVPEYPPIVDTSPKAKKAHVKEEWHNKIKSLKTVEEKLFAINLPKYFGWNSLVLSEGIIPYNILPLTQFVTRTHIIDGPGLPEHYSNPTIEEVCTRLCAEIKPQIEEALVVEHSVNRQNRNSSYRTDSNLSPAETENRFGTSVVQQVNRILLASLSPEFPHLLGSQVDLEPRVEAFWFTGGIDPPACVRKSKEKLDFLKDRANESVDRCVQYLGSPVLQVRGELPLPQFVPLEEYEGNELAVPQFGYDPRVLGVRYEFRNGTTVPGFWPGDQSEFGLISYHNRGHLLDRPSHYGENDRQESLLVQAILASYSWTLGQACYQGFSTCNELTYPLVTQTVITNGQHWSFFSYQLNTTLLHSENALSNPRRNICWGTDELKLFESIDNEKIIGFNEDVLKTLVRFYVNTPEVRAGVEMKPHLEAQEGPHVAHVSDPERRAWLEAQYKHMCTNRPRHRLPDEIYNWERIYKINNNTRPLDKKWRPFELSQNPYARKYGEHQPRYVPKKLRPGDGKNRSKWAKTYYP